MTTTVQASAGALLLLASVCCGGCVSATGARSVGEDPVLAKRAERAVIAAQSQSPIYQNPELQEAIYYREIGADHLGRAYHAKSRLTRDTRFDLAFAAFQRSSTAYHRALGTTEPAQHGLIEGEIEQVAEYMRRIIRDREPPIVD